ncbi:hypothetical protein [Endozoicomonas sp. Mp262]|uniref:phage integrase n=1 Tax=Endozoicomonas sp. Mp262 TaxID=2919499 RepID=UPI0021DB306B
MAIKKSGHQWKIDFRIGSKRYRHTAKTKIECLQYRDEVIATRGYQKTEKDDRNLSSIIDIWYQARGIELADNIRTKQNLMRFCHTLGNPLNKIDT